MIGWLSRHFFRAMDVIDNKDMPKQLSQSPLFTETGSARDFHNDI